MMHEILPHKLDIAYTPRDISASDRVILGDDRNVFVLGDRERLELPSAADYEFCAEPRYLFSIDNIGYYTADVSAPDGCTALTIRELRHAQPQHTAFAAVLGWRLRDWYEKNRYCGRCGTALVHSETERAMCCKSCGNIIYPTICPSVIIALTDGDRLLLTRYQQSHSQYQRYALCAGYIESGETAEEAVSRELMEEVGLRAKNIKYYKSQPWPFSGALLLGYFCELDGSDVITRDDSELSEAVWMRREDLPDRSGDVSLTSEMMEQFRLGLI